MAQFCKIAGKVTNCTDKCKACLEEEAKTRDIKVGDKVRYTTEDIDEVKESGYFPPKGTIGAVIGIDSDCAAPYHIKWPAGTTKWDGCWYADRDDIELAENFD